MKFRFFAPLVAAASLIPAMAQAAPGFTDERLAMHAGPSHKYPDIVELNEHTPVEIHGCLADYDWCDVSAGRFRGWVDGDDLSVSVGGKMYEVDGDGRKIGVPVLGFHFDDYWQDNYSASAFYQERQQYRDMDLDGVPNEVDADRDGDGVTNRDDIMPNDRDSN
jgi:uncharacterized protein YraI